jgi:hypothetical protein
MTGLENSAVEKAEILTVPTPSARPIVIDENGSSRIGILSWLMTKMPFRVSG